MKTPGLLRYYILDDEHHVVPVDMMTWAKWFEHGSNRTVAWTQVTSEITVSTVFLGMDHRFWGDGPPLLFETMIFAPDEVKKKLVSGDWFWGEWMWRYSSWDDARTGHAAAVRKARKAIGQRVRADQKVSET